MRICFSTPKTPHSSLSHSHRRSSPWNFVYLSKQSSSSISSPSREREGFDQFFFLPVFSSERNRHMADFFPPFTPSPRSTSLAVAPSASSSAENSPPTALTRSSPSPRLRREQRKVLHPLADESDDGYSPHPSIYEASPVASDDEGRDDKEPLCDSYDSVKQNSAELLDPEQPGSPDSTGRGRNFSRFSGLSMMETIAEQKSIASTRDEMLDGGAYSPLQQDEESEDDGDEQYYYDYASPTQPLHPVMSASAPNLGGRSPRLYHLHLISDNRAQQGHHTLLHPNTPHQLLQLACSSHTAYPHHLVRFLLTSLPSAQPYQWIDPTEP